MLKMGKKLYLLCGKERREALGSLERLDDFDYGLGLEPLSPEETEIAQRKSNLDRLSLRETKTGYKKSKESKNKEKYGGFVKATVNQGINVENVFKDIQAKKRNLIEYLEYSTLKGLDGERIPLNNAKDSRIGKAYLDHYNRARRILGMINTDN